MVNNRQKTTTLDERPARSPGATYQELLDSDTHIVPSVLRLQSPKFLGAEDISVERYISYDWHRLEVDRLWRRVWQFEIGRAHV